MAKKDTKKSLKDMLVDTALALAANRAWNDISFQELIDIAKVDLADAYEYFDDTADILTAYGRRIDRRVLQAFTERSDGLSEREQLFDLLMERLDILNEDRAAILSILSSLKSDPKQAVLTLPHLGKSMSRMLDCAGVQTHGVIGALKVTALLGVYGHVLRVWKDDESPDMAKTMASLDKALGYLESAANSFLNKGRFSFFSEKEGDFPGDMGNN